MIIGDHPDGRGLASAVGAEQSQNTSGLSLERDVVHGEHLFILLADALDLKGVHFR